MKKVFFLLAWSCFSLSSLLGDQLTLLSVLGTGRADIRPDIVVAADGSGDFRTVEAAVASVPKDNRQRVIIYIRDGVYREKVRADASDITLCGESRRGTRIEYPQSMPDFEAHPDKLGRAVLNINGDDFVAENLTIANTDGVIGPHEFAVYGVGDRTVLQHCDIVSEGADTVSLWNAKSGRYYQNDCLMRGAVDFVCPRGWCYIENSSFFETKATASVWHDGHENKTMKFVLRNCRFDGVSGWKLARHHVDAQFYFLNCDFGQTMADQPPYRVIYPLHPGKSSPADIKRNAELAKWNKWGNRVYFENCHRDGGDYHWMANNLARASGHPKMGEITPDWAFGGKWNPVRSDAPRVVKISRDGTDEVVQFSEPVTAKGKPELRYSSGRTGAYLSGSGGVRLVFRGSPVRSDSVLKIDPAGRAVIATLAYAKLREADLSLPK